MSRPKGVVARYKRVTCVTCSQPFMAQRRDAKYCSTDCRPNSYRAKRSVRVYFQQCDHCDEQFSARYKHSRYCAKCRCPKKGGLARHLRVDSTHYEGTCLTCGEPFTCRHKSQAYCSKPCGFKSPRMGRNGISPDVVTERRLYKRWAARARTREKIAARRRIVLADRGHAKILLTKCCVICGVDFQTNLKTKVYCNEKCARRAARGRHRAKRRAIERGADAQCVDPYKVFTIYQWQCAWCGVDTPRSRRGGIEDNAPELDHVLPIALGGRHEYWNTQLLCRSCNNAKSGHYVERPSVPWQRGATGGSANL